MDSLVYPPLVRGAGPYPRVALAVVAAFGVLAGAFAAWRAVSLFEEGFVLTAAALALTGIPFGVALVAMGVAPAAADRALGRFSRATLADGGHVFAVTVIAATLFVVFGLFSLVDGANAYEMVARGEEGESVALTEGVLLTGLVLNFFVLVAPVLIWYTFVHNLRASEVPRAIGLAGGQPLHAIGIGILVAFGAVALIAVLSLAAAGLGFEIPENDRALDIAQSLSVPAAIAVAVLSGVTEEVFFRGFLYPRVGLLAQAVLFSMAHLSYVNFLEIVVTFTLGLGFGLLYRKTRSLWAPVAAHFGFNLVMLLLGRVAP